MKNKFVGSVVAGYESRRGSVGYFTLLPLSQQLAIARGSMQKAEQDEHQSFVRSPICLFVMKMRVYLPFMSVLVMLLTHLQPFRSAG